MAPIRLIMLAVFAFTSLQSALGALKCEELPMEVCAFSVSSSGARCVLEKSIMRDGSAQYDCLTSEVVAEKIYEWIETQECMDACGLDRMQVGMSTDPLMESGFTKKLCSPECYNDYPNIVNLFFNLAAGEGLDLPRLCEAHKTGSRRMMAQVLASARPSMSAESVGFAPAPLSSEDVTAAPASSPSP
uniref:TSA: Wollemia nobilis Ref_Wollemi_Transcript_14508_971 transcribed RNA sequence n=1 Tax=Wollemia nobilis TaxID=56998 RepID=A0A0C9RJJ7_9CONI